MAPTITPFTKYRCKKGYKSKTGTLATTITAYFRLSASICWVTAPSVSIISSIFDCINSSRRTICKGYFSRSVM